VTGERKVEDMALMAGGARQRLDDLRNSGSLSWNEWAKKVRELDRIVDTAVSNRWIRKDLA
jgi:hypothetical protein